MHRCQGATQHESAKCTALPMFSSAPRRREGHSYLGIIPRDRPQLKIKDSSGCLPCSARDSQAPFSSYIWPSASKSENGRIPTMRALSPKSRLLLESTSSDSLSCRCFHYPHRSQATLSRPFSFVGISVFGSNNVHSSQTCLGSAHINVNIVRSIIGLELLEIALGKQVLSIIDIASFAKPRAINVLRPAPVARIGVHLHCRCVVIN